MITIDDRLRRLAAPCSVVQLRVRTEMCMRARMGGAHGGSCVVRRLRRLVVEYSVALVERAALDVLPAQPNEDAAALGVLVVALGR